MVIGIDLSPLQGPHRKRGIGYTLINLVNNIPADEKAKHRYIFFAVMDLGVNSLELLDLSDINYEVRPVRPRRYYAAKLPGKLHILASVFNNLLSLKDLYIGNSRIYDVGSLDSFIQIDQAQCLPRRRGLKKVLFLHDVIPYAIEWDYLATYKTVRKIFGYSRKGALRYQARRWLYAKKAKLNTRRADLLLANSEHTKNDFVNLLGVTGKKIVVTPLGVNQALDTGNQTIDLHQYKKTSWGYLKQPELLNINKPFLLFIGGADGRRKLDDLVTAFNLLRAQGHDLNLVLAGDSMEGPENIASLANRRALKASSYIDDILFVGFTDDPAREWLYKNALAFVFPSRYEGFGLPVLEAMAHGCPVISYKNPATEEVAGQSIAYANDQIDLMETILEVLNYTKNDRKLIAEKEIRHTKSYSWEKTAANILKLVTRS